MSSTRLYRDRSKLSDHFPGYTQMGNIPLATHEGTDGARLAEVETTDLGSEGARKELGEERNNTQQDCVPPCDAVIQEAQVRPETGKGEVLEKASQPNHTELYEQRSNRIGDIPTEGEEWKRDPQISLPMQSRNHLRGG